MKKLSKLLLIIIFILIIAAGVLYYVIRNLSSSISTSDEENVENEIEEEFIDDTINNENEKYYMLEPINFREVTASYQGQTELIDVKRSLYQEVKKYRKDGEIITPRAESMQSDDENYFAFKLILDFEGNKEITLVVKIGIQENEIKYEIYDELSEVFKIYQGNVAKEEVEAAIQDIILNAKTIYNQSTGLSLNKVLQYYDLHEEEINRYNIYDRESYYKVTNQIVRIDWSQNPECTYYTVQNDTIEIKDNYLTFDIIFVYSNGDAITLKAELTQAQISLSA